MSCATKNKTQFVKARILTDGYEIEGNVRMRQGDGMGRVSDILSTSDTDFIPVTQARCTNRLMGSSSSVETDCTMLQVRTIRKVLPFEDF